MGGLPPGGTTGQMGPMVAQRIQGPKLVKLLGWLFLAVAIITLGEVVLG